MNFAKKTLPLIFGMLVGFFALAELYLPNYRVQSLASDLENWAAILSAAAYVLGAVNVLQFNLPKIRRRERDWQFKIVLLAAAAVMFTVGALNLVIRPSQSGKTEISAGADPAAAAAGKAVVVFETPADVMVTAAGIAPTPGKDAAGKAARFEVTPGPTGFRVFRRKAGYLEYSEADWVKPLVADYKQRVAAAEGRLAKATGRDRDTIEAEIAALEKTAPTAPVLAAGDVMTVHGDPPMLWGKEGRVFTWFYDHVFAPCNSTMFALLAFFVASAAFRAFRARNVEAGLLLGGAILVMLGRVPIGRAISETLPSIAQWILDVPNNGSRRAIMMGAAIGAIATGVRILLGLERSHLGADDQ